MAFNLGDVFVTFKAKTEDLQQGVTRVKTMAADVEKSVNHVSFREFSSQASSAFGNVAATIQGVATKAALLGVAGSVGMGAMAKAAFGQVKAVEEASFALRAYEKDAGKVNKVLNDLVAFARSDMGVLFQRQDLFDAASTLRMYGQATDTLTDKVKILSKGVSLGKTTFQELSQIVGRAAARGRLDAVDFDMLIERGIGLDKSMRGASVTSEKLFQALDKALPAELLQGRANTIQGHMIRLQSSFRDLGLSILGVDRDTSQFIKGGLGDRFVKMMASLRDVLASAELKQAFGKMGQQIAGFAERAIPLAIKGFTWLLTHGDVVRDALIGIAAAFVAAKLGAIGFAIAASPFTFTVMALATAVTVLIAALTFLQLRFNIIGQTLGFLQPYFDRVVAFFDKYFKPSVEALGRVLIDNLLPALLQIWDAVKRLWDALNPGLVTALQVLGVVLGAILVGAVWLAINVINVFAQALSLAASLVANLINWISNLISWFGNMIGAAINAVGAVVGWFGRLPGTIGSIVDKVADSFKGLPDRIGSALSGIGDIISSPFKAAFNAISRLWNGSVGKLNFKVPDWVPGIGGKGFTLPALPALALGTPDWRGGVVGMNEFGPETAILPKGTRVVTADQTRRSEGSAGGNTYNFNLNGILARSDSELADIMENAIQTLDRRLMGAGKPQILGGRS